MLSLKILENLEQDHLQFLETLQLEAIIPLWILVEEDHQHMEEHTLHIQEETFLQMLEAIFLLILEEDHLHMEVHILQIQEDNFLLPKEDTIQV